MSDDLTTAITALADTMRAQAQVAREFLALHERLWLALPPRTRAEFLGLSARQERNRRKKDELRKLCES